MIWKHGLKYITVYMQKLLNPGHQNLESNLKQSKQSTLDTAAKGSTANVVNVTVLKKWQETNLQTRT